MNIHTLLDSIIAWTGALAARKQKFFSQSTESPTFAEYFEQLSLEAPEIEGEGKHFVEVEPPHIFHHGNNEDPFDMGRSEKHSFKMIFESQKEETPANIIALRAPFHGISLKEYTSRIAHLSNFVALIAASVVLAEALVKQIKEHSEQPVLISGISLGGWVTNLHRTHYNSADCYVPLLAGAALAEVFLTSKYKKLTGDLALESPDVVRQRLNFEEAFSKVKTKNVSPLLGRYDQFIRYERQKQCYEDLVEPVVLDKGHVTALLAASILYEHIMETLSQVTQNANNEISVSER